MLKRDSNGKFLYKETGFFTKKRLFGFRSGSTATDFFMEENQYNALLEFQKHQPVIVMNDTSSKKRWWMFCGEFWWEDEGYTVDEVKFLILDKLQQKKREVFKAIARVTQNEPPSAEKRLPIPNDVKMYVWQRDGGRCVKCGSQQNLEYDHIIPIAKGGSNTARNIQLLCEHCNRSNGANLF
jgi:hypothetical protein